MTRTLAGACDIPRRSLGLPFGRLSAPASASRVPSTQRLPRQGDGGGIAPRGRTRERAVVIVPTYSERATIEAIVARLYSAAPSQCDLLVVDDSSPDGTAEIVRALMRRHPQVRLIERAEKEGLGTAYVTGFRWAIENGYDFIVQMDGDLSHDPADVPRLLDALAGADVVIGSRYVPGGKVVNWGPLRRALSIAGNLYARMFLGFSIKDSTSGFRAWRVSWLEEQDLGSIRSEGYAFQVEMTRRAFRAEKTMVEIPIVFTERSAGRSKMSRFIILEALVRVTAWGISDRLVSVGRSSRRSRSRASERS